MKNLEKIEVQELTSIEQRELEGGFFPIVLAAAAYFVWESATNPSSTYQNYLNGVRDGYNYNN